MIAAAESRGAASPPLDTTLSELEALRAEMIASAEGCRESLGAVHPNYRASAENLLHYLAMRRHDLRPLQMRLAQMGLSSLGRAESSVMATVDAVVGALYRLGQRPWCPPTDIGGVDFETGRRLLAHHTQSLLGPASPGRSVRIMVTMPGEAATEYTLIHDLLKGGMNCMRINCAHDDSATWKAMIDNLRRAEHALDRTCRVVMDLAGPKLRTGPVEPGPAVIKIRPTRDIYGRVTAPARVWLMSATSPHPSPTPADACLPMPPQWLNRLQVSEPITFFDARGARRRLLVVDVTPDGCWAELRQTAYFAPGTRLARRSKLAGSTRRRAVIGDLPRHENALLLAANDTLILSRNLTPGRPKTCDSEGHVLTPASIGCTIPAVFDTVQSGEAIWFDDGKIGGVVERVESDHVFVRIRQTPPGGGKLRADKGINLPESELSLPALTDKDIQDLAFVAQHADVIELSFANTAADVELLLSHLRGLTRREPAIVLKIETRRGFDNLPEMLLAAMRWPCCGVMIARGDLAVETGFERLAEVQEEILWICEAAHIPVIWATQVLESLAKEGMASRAEITDAAMGDRAECVMLNKGPHILAAVHILDDILHRMQAHQSKKRAMLRELKLAHALGDSPDADESN